MSGPALPDLDRAAAHWQWALDATKRALDADRDLLPAGEIQDATGRLALERRQTALLLDRVAATRVSTPHPWLAPGPVSPRMLGLPHGTRACIFDLDGVLTDSNVLHAAAWADALEPVLMAAAREADRPYTPFDCNADYGAYFDGRLRLEGIRLFLAGRGIQLCEAGIARIAARKGAFLEHRLRAHRLGASAGAHRYLQAAGLAHLGRAVVSASQTARPMLELAGLAHLVDQVVDATTVQRLRLRTQPEPDILIEACRALGVPVESAVSLTRSRGGVVAAREAGIVVLPIGDGAQSLCGLLDSALRG